MQKFILLLLLLTSTIAFGGSSASNPANIGNLGGVQASSCTAYTPTFAGIGTPSAVNFCWYRIGDFLYVQGKFTSGTTSAANFSISLPSGLAIDTTYFPDLSKLGEFAKSAVPNNYISILANPSLSTTLVYGSFIQTGGYDALNPQFGSNIIGSSSVWSGSFKVKISGWQVGGIGGISSASTSYDMCANDLSSTSYSSGNTQSFATSDFDNSGGAWNGTNTYTAPVAGRYAVSCTLKSTGTVFAGNSMQQNVKVAGTQKAQCNAFSSSGSTSTIEAASGSTVVTAAAGDAITIYITGTTSYPSDGTNSNRLCIYKLP